MNKTLISILIVISLAAAMFAMACDPPPPPPPPEPADCSPGFWKQSHHFDYWIGYAPGDDYNNDMTLLEALQGGKKTRVSRFIVAGMLNVANPDAPCD